MEPPKAFISSSQNDFGPQLAIEIVNHRKICSNLIRGLDESSYKEKCKKNVSTNTFPLGCRPANINVKCPIPTTQNEYPEKLQVREIIHNIVREALGLDDRLPGGKETTTGTTCECEKPFCKANKRVEFSGVDNSDQKKDGKTKSRSPIINVPTSRDTGDTSDEDSQEEKAKKKNRKKLRLIEAASSPPSKARKATETTQAQSQSCDYEWMLSQLCTIKSRIDAQMEQLEGLRQISGDLKKLYRAVKNQQMNTSEKGNGDSKNAKGALSTSCFLCLDQKLPILTDSLHCALFKVIGNRRLFDILLTVYLRSDGIYHINVRDINQGNSLGCLLCNTYAMKEALDMGLFEQMATFCISDPAKELRSRQCGGGIGAGCDFHEPIKELVDKSKKWIDLLDSHHRDDNYKVSLQITKIKSKYVLPDDDANYLAQYLELTSMGNLLSSSYGDDY